MRRQGYEFQVTKPVVLYKEIDGVQCEPIERVVCDVPTEYSGVVIEKLGRRRGHACQYARAGPHAPGVPHPLARAVWLPQRFPHRHARRGRDERRVRVLRAGEGRDPHAAVRPLWLPFETGEATSYALFSAQDRGELFIEPGAKVYSGMIVGRNSRPGDIDVNVCRKKHMTNSRNSRRCRGSAEDHQRAHPHHGGSAGIHRRRRNWWRSLPSPSACASACSTPRCARSWKAAKSRADRL